MINATERLSKRVRTAMGDHNNDDLPVTQCVINMRKEVEALQAEFVIRLDEVSTRNYELRMDLAEKTSECEQLRKAIRQLCNIYVVDDYYSGDLRKEQLSRAVERAIDTHRKQQEVEA